MPKASVHSMGCKVSQYDGAKLMDALGSFGFSPCDDGLPDLFVLNACAVTQRAESEALRLLRRVRRENPKASVLVMGCLATHLGQRLVREGLADFLSPAGSDIPSVLGRLPGAVPAPGGDPPPFPSQHRSRAFLKAQDGCDAGCAYCVIPGLRGRPKSVPLARILEGVRHYQDQGFHELVLTGIHLGSWGSDLSPRTDLPGLLAGLEREFSPDPRTFRLRLSSVEPREADALLGLFQRFPFLAPHLHIPLQSGSDRILSSMGRPYVSSYYERLVRSFVEMDPGMSIGADVMAGFPGETESDFLESLDFVRRLPLSYLHVFSFSARPGARASGFAGQVPPKIRRERAMAFRALDEIKRESFREAQYGKPSLLLVESSPHVPSGRPKGITGNYLRALLPRGAPATPGGLLPVTFLPPENAYGVPEARP
jgi:threonylcarbamoyladenosine tRNA methylthiotransferase MtaB